MSTGLNWHSRDAKATSAQSPILIIWKLPEEIIIEILKEIDNLLDLLTCRLTCRYFKDIIDTDSWLKLKVELAANGVRVGTKALHEMDPKTLLDRLRRFRQSWLELDWKVSEIYPVPPNQYRTECVVSGGIVSMMLKDPPDSFSTTIQFKQLPASRSHRWTKEWSYHILYDFFVVSTCQDLLVLWEPDARMHLLSLSSNTPHPLAQMPIINYKQQKGEAWKVKIFQDLMVIWFRDPTLIHGDLVFCNWQTTEWIQCPGHPKLSSFTVISRDWTMTSTLEEKSRVGVLHLFPHTGGRSVDLLLPKTKSNILYTNVIVADSIPSSSPDFPKQNSAIEPVFIATGDVDVILLELFYHSSNLFSIGDAANHNWHFLVAISRNKLVEIVEERVREHDNSSEKGLVIDWEDWGPDITRWFSAWNLWYCDWGMHSSRFACMSRTLAAFDGNPSISLVGGETFLEYPALLVLDFNPYLVSSGVENKDSARVYIRVVKDEHPVGENLFANPVVCRLPFVATMVPQTGYFSKVQSDTRTGNIVLHRRGGDIRVLAFDSEK